MVTPIQELERQVQFWKEAEQQLKGNKFIVGHSIRVARKAKGISLKEVADKVTCSVSFLSDVELSRRFPSEEVLEKIVKVLKSL